MSPLGVTVTTSEVSQSGGISTTIGTMFLVAPAAYGPETPTLVRSLSEGIALYGARVESESTKMYDALNTFFSLEGARVWVNRIAGAGSPAAAKLELEAGSIAKTLLVTAKYKGTLGNKLKVEVVENAGKTESHVVIYNAEGEVVETSPEFLTAKAIYEWGKTHETYVIISEGSGYSTGKSEVLKALAAKALSTGANPTVSEATTIKTIEGYPKGLGPGQLVVPANFEEKVHTAMAEHCSKNNRFAICDLKEAEKAATTVATLTGEKGTYASSIASYLSFYSTAVTAVGATGGTTRTIQASPLIAGLMAKVSRTGNNNQAPAGRAWPLAPYVVSLINTYNEANMETLNEKGINNIVERFGVLCLYGDRTAVEQSVDPIFFQYSAVRERMQLVAEAEEIGERFIFATLDGRHQKRSKFAGELQGLIKNHWEKGALYGETAQEAGIVNVGEPINTPTSEQAGELKAEMIVRISPVAEAVKINIVAKQITEVV